MNEITGESKGSPFFVDGKQSAMYNIIRNRKGRWIMTGEEIFGLIMMLGCCFGCGAMFYGIGLWAERSKKPFGFWTFKEVKPESISDIPAYNRENGRMWKRYALPFFLAGILACISIWISAVLLICSCTVGIWWLIRGYQKIFRKYSAK